MAEKTESSKPSWMPDRTAAQERELAQSDHDIAVAYAQYCKRFPRAPAKTADPSEDDGALIYLAMTATGFAACDTLPEWSQFADDYRGLALPADTAIRKSNPIVAARAIYLRAAITRLLALARAPAAMVADVNSLLAPLCPSGAVKRAKIQKTILENPSLGVRGAASKIKSSPGQISNDRKAGTIATPAGGVWSDPD